MFLCGRVFLIGKTLRHIRHSIKNNTIRKSSPFVSGAARRLQLGGHST